MAEKSTTLTLFSAENRVSTLQILCRSALHVSFAGCRYRQRKAARHEQQTARLCDVQKAFYPAQRPAAVLLKTVLLRAKHHGYVPSAIRRPPEPVYIRLPKRLPVFPEFQLEPGRVYKADRYQSLQCGRVTYIVTLDKEHRTIVRQEECEEVAHE